MEQRWWRRKRLPRRGAIQLAQAPEVARSVLRQVDASLTVADRSVFFAAPPR
jgi:hypothetical protein